jgi:O-antigen ligase
MTVLASSAPVGIASRRRGLLWSEHLYLIAAMVAAIVVVDPLEWQLATQTVVKHLALMIALAGIAATLIGRRLGSPLQRRRHVAGSLRAAWPMLTLALMIVGGSLYARLFHDIQSTFLNVGLYMLMMFGAAAMVMQSDRPEALLRDHFRILFVAAAIMGGLLILNYGVRQVYHEEIFLVIPIAALFFARTERGFLGWSGFAYFLSMAWFSHKYTSYFIGALTVAYLTLFVALPRMSAQPRLYRMTAAYWFFILAFFAAALGGYFAIQGSVDLPTGNPEYRLHTYAIAWERFTESPLWGTFFTAESVEKFTPYEIGVAGGRLPTHSDVLDLLANGGVLALLLWVFGLAAILRVAFRKLLHPEFVRDSWAPYGHTLAVLSFAGVFAYAFNPILLQPSMSYLLWANLGLLLGLSMRALEGNAG